MVAQLEGDHRAPQHHHTADYGPKHEVEHHLKRYQKGKQTDGHDLQGTPFQLLSLN